MAVAAVVGPIAAMWASVRGGSLASVAVTADAIVVTARGLNAVWALRRRVVIPRSSVTAVEEVRRAELRLGWRVPGTALPGVIVAGTYRRRGWKVFWLVGRARRVTVISCDATGPFDQVVLELGADERAKLDRLVT